ncbi:MAG: hypothetical protein FD174_2591 [Geobacteraceae bacterium]|nr:MAG: hypothetical protein FD174_2591 [Geobacteraceae bacterium]
MKIPKRFRLMGHIINVVEEKRLAHERNWNGAALYDECLIQLLPISEQHPRAESKFEQTFCHELAHWLLYYAGGAVNHNLGGEYVHNNEEFVDLLGSLIHQAFDSMEFD